jgi:hypothetical protein
MRFDILIFFLILGPKWPMKHSPGLTLAAGGYHPHERRSPA